MQCEFAHSLQVELVFGLGPIFHLVTLTHVTLLAILSLGLSPVIQAVPHGPLRQQARNLPRNHLWVEWLHTRCLQTSQLFLTPDSLYRIDFLLYFLDTSIAI
jgi:hypothetical protein